MIRQDHGINLYSINQVGVVADQSGQLRLANLLQLLGCEG